MYVNFTMIVDFSHNQYVLTAAKYIEVLQKIF